MISTITDADQTAAKFLNKIGQEVLVQPRGKSQLTKNADSIPVVILESFSRFFGLTSID